MMARVPVPVGETFGLLTVIGEAPDRDHARIWRCRCACGVEKNVRACNIQNGCSRSCGAREHIKSGRLKHGMYGTRTHRIWRGMRARCQYSSQRSFAYYGGKGIGVCERWQEFENFLADMGQCPPGLTIERRDNSRGYEPGNCRWATTLEQGRNTSRNRVETIFGESKPVSAWGTDARCVVGPRAFQSRLSRGWSAERALTEPLSTQGRKPVRALGAPA